MASAKPGQLILFEDEADDGFRRAGLVKEVTDEYAQVHEYAPNQTVTRWLPVWISPTNEQDTRRKCPDGWTAMQTDVNWNQVLMTGELQKESLSEDTKRRATAAGYDWALPGTKAGP
jgi:hypothetical protein